MDPTDEGPEPEAEEVAAPPPSVYAKFWEATDRRTDRKIERALAPLIARIEELERRTGAVPPDHPTEREIDVGGHVYALAALPAGEGAGWLARIERYSLTANAAALQHPILDQRSQLHDQAAIITTVRATGPTAQAALDALAERLRAVVAEATQVDPGSRT